MANQFGGLVADVPGAFERGKQFRQAELLRPGQLEQQQLGTQRAQQQLVTGGLQQQAIQQGIETEAQKAKSQNLFNTVERLRATPDAQKGAILEQNIIDVESRNGDATESRQALDMFNQGRFDELNQSLDILHKQGVQTGFLKADAKLQKGEKGTVFDPAKGVFSVDPVAAQNQRDINKQNVEHKKQILALEVEATKAKERVKGLAAREKTDIDNGLLAAQTMPILKRADKLLDIVATGKPAQMRLWAKKWFGVSPANETELDNLLGKQILKQLKPTFGSQFTAKEGDWLKDIEANFGKSTEGNRALIRQGMDLVKERASIGIEAANASQDKRTSDNIQGWLDWQFGEDPQAGKTTIELNQQSDDDLLSF